MATHSSILAWEIPWIEELGGVLNDLSHLGCKTGLTSLTGPFKMFISKEKNEIRF